MLYKSPRHFIEYGAGVSFRKRAASESRLHLSISRILTTRRIRTNVYLAEPRMFTDAPVYMRINCKYTNMRLHAYVTYIHAYMIHADTDRHTYMHACMHAYMNACIHEYACTCVYIYICSYRYVHINVHYVYMLSVYVCIPLYTYTHMYIYIYLQVCLA